MKIVEANKDEIGLILSHTEAAIFRALLFSLDWGPEQERDLGCDFASIRADLWEVCRIEFEDIIGEIVLTKIREETKT